MNTTADAAATRLSELATRPFTTAVRGLQASRTAGLLEDAGVADTVMPALLDKARGLALQVVVGRMTLDDAGEQFSRALQQAALGVALTATPVAE